jgi:uncharacterized protein (DUF488 family)
MTRLFTIGYEAATPDDFLATLQQAGVGLLVDVRAVASSRRPGFAKTRLSENLKSVGIEYVHLRGLGTPADGRAAARAGRHAEMQQIFRQHMATIAAREELHALVELVGAERPLCLLCFEADPAHCHRTLVASAVADLVPVEIVHLFPAPR